MNMIFGVKDRPKFGQTILFAIQQLLAIMAATLVVPVITNGATGSTLSPAAALFGAGVGTLVYLLFTKFRSPVFLGSSFAFLGSMAAAFAGGVSMTLGYAGLILGAVFAGFVYVIIAAAVKVAGVKWLDRLMPVVVIGPTVSIIGLSLAGNAVSDLIKGSVVNAEGAAVASPLITVLCGLAALLVTMLCATYGKKMVRLIPFILGILAGYAVAAVFTLIGNATATDALKVLDFSKLSVLWENGVTLKTFVNYELVTKDFVFLKAAKGFAELNWGYVGAIAVAYVPVAFVVFAEHIADHKNISSIIGKDLLKDPGLSRTLLGDGVGSMAGALLGGCPNTTYGESVACVAITRNASVVTILATAILAMLNDAVKKGGSFASSHVGGLSGAFIPVSEDAGMIDAARCGALSLVKLEAMTAVCSVGLDMIAIPGDTPAEVISAIIADEAAIGMVNSKTTAVRLIPAIGKTAGDELNFGGLLGGGPVMEVNRYSPAKFIHRGGRIPAPMQSLKN